MDFGKNLHSKRKQVLNLKRKQQNEEEEDKFDNTPLRALLSNMSKKNIRVLFWNEQKKEFDGKILNQVRFFIILFLKILKIKIFIKQKI